MSDSSGEKITFLGRVDYRNQQITFGIKDKDRNKHMYMIGKTGMGKSTLMENMIIQDINNGEGLCVIDPHGSLAEKLLDFIPEHRIKDTIYFSPSDTEFPLGLNVLEKVDADKRHLVADGLMAAFKKVFGEDRFSDRIQYILNNIILALLENEGQSLLGVNRMLSDKEYRKFIVSNIKDPSVRSFWEEEYARAGDKYQQEAAPGIQNKIGQYTSNPFIRNIIGQKTTSFNLRDIMDNRKILIVNLSKGKVGEGNAHLLGSLLITKIYLAAMSRADVGVYELEKLPPFYFYVDEFQNFANESFGSILSEARKYNLALTVANQYVEQITDEVKSAVFGNVGTMITFRVGATDAEIFEKEFAPYFVLDDFVNLPAYHMYIRLMIDGVGSKPFSAGSLSPVPRPEHSHRDAVIAQSRKEYSKSMQAVDEEINQFYKPIIHHKEQPKEERVEEKAPEERRGRTEVRVREIRDDTPLPSQRHDRNGNGKSGKNHNHTGDRQSYEGPRPPKLEMHADRPFASTPLKEQSKEKVTSLKDALTKAMKEHEQSKEEVSSSEKDKDDVAVKANEVSNAKPKEIAEEVLRQLVDDQ